MIKAPPSLPGAPAGVILTVPPPAFIRRAGSHTKPDPSVQGGARSSFQAQLDTLDTLVQPSTGVVYAQGTQPLQVSALGGMKVGWAGGQASIVGALGASAPAGNVTIAPADPVYDRFDLIVCDINGNVTVLQGQPSGTPIFMAPVLDAFGNPTVAFMAAVHVGAGVTSLDDRDITDKRTVLNFPIVTVGDNLLGTIVPTGALRRWRVSQKPVKNIVWGGDSTVGNTGGTNPLSGGSYDGAPTKLGRILAGELGSAPPSYGFRGLWSSEWTIGSNWVVISNSPYDCAPFGSQSYQNSTPGTTAANILTWTRPAGVPVQMIRLFIADELLFSIPLSYSVDGGTTWNNLITNGPASVFVRTADIVVTNPTTLQIRSSNSAGGGSGTPTPSVLGLIPYSQLNLGNVTFSDGVTSGATIKSYVVNALTLPQPIGWQLIGPGIPNNTFVIASNQNSSNNQITLTLNNSVNYTVNPGGPFTLIAPGNGLGLGAVVHNMGAAGNYLFNFVGRTVSGGAQPFALLDTLAPDLLILGPFTNDIASYEGQGNTDAAGAALYGQSFQTIIQHYNALGTDVLIIGSWEQDGRSLPGQTLFRQAAQAAAQNYGAAFLDMRACWGGYGQACAQGLMNDGLHQSQLGSSDLASRVGRLLRQFS